MTQKSPDSPSSDPTGPGQVLLRKLYGTSADIVELQLELIHDSVRMLEPVVSLYKSGADPDLMHDVALYNFALIRDHANFALRLLTEIGAEDGRSIRGMATMASVGKTTAQRWVNNPMTVNDLQATADHLGIDTNITPESLKALATDSARSEPTGN